MQIAEKDIVDAPKFPFFIPRLPDDHPAQEGPRQLKFK
jgi:hypothetical protein